MRRSRYKKDRILRSTPAIWPLVEQKQKDLRKDKRSRKHEVYKKGFPFIGICPVGYFQNEIRSSRFDIGIYRVVLDDGSCLESPSPA